MTRDEGIARMTAFAARQPTGTLCEALLMLDAKRKPSEEERLTRAVLLDVLCERHPEADAAFDAWAADESTLPPHGAAQVVAEAARKAAKAATQ